jgi:ketosteroid isomerase-like protein
MFVGHPFIRRRADRMLRFHQTVIVVACLLVAGCRQPSAEISSEDAAGVRAQIDEYVRASLAGDIQAWGNTLAPDAVTMPPNAAPLEGREAAIEWFKGFPKITSFTVEPTEVTGSGDVAYARGTYTFTAALPDGSSVTDRGSFLEIHRRAADGTWPYTRLIWHSDTPPPASAGAADPRVGTWSLNLSKSTFSPGPAPKSQTLRIEPAGTGEKVTVETVDAAGNRTTSSYTANYDEGDSPLTGAASPTRVSLRRIDSHTTERIDRQNGKVIQTIRRTVSPDNKTMTVTIRGIDAKGGAIESAGVYERQ